MLTVFDCGRYASGSVDDLSSIAAALRGCYGVWVNVDGFTVGEQKEIYAGIRIFELSKQTQSLRHYVWSSLDYGLKVGNIMSCMSPPLTRSFIPIERQLQRDL